MLMAKKNKFIPVYYVNNETFEGDLNEVYGVRAFPLSWVLGKTYHISFDYEITNITRLYTTNYLMLRTSPWCDQTNNGNVFFRKDYIETGDEYRGHIEFERECIQGYRQGDYWAFLFNNSASNMTACHTKISNICIWRKDLIKSIFYADEVERNSTSSSTSSLVNIPARTTVIGKTYHLHFKYSCTITSESVEGAGVSVRIRATAWAGWASLFTKDMALGETVTGTIDLDISASREQAQAYLVELSSFYNSDKKGSAHWEFTDITAVEAE